MKWKEFIEKVNNIGSEFHDTDVVVWGDEYTFLFKDLQIASEDMVQDPLYDDGIAISLKYYLNEYPEDYDQNPPILYKKGFPALIIEE